MIAHVSIPSSQPEAIAKFLARIIEGEAFPFPTIAGAWITFCDDGSGTAIEVYPLGTVGRPGGIGQGVQTTFDPHQSMASAHHIAISSKLPKNKIMELAQEMGFHTVPCERSKLFEVVEVWIENGLLIEVLTPSELRRYLSISNSETFKSKFGSVQSVLSREAL